MIDVTLAGTRADKVEAALTALSADAGTDMVLSVVGSSAQFRPHDAVAGITGAVKTGLGKPIAAFLVPQADASLRLLGEAGIPAFRTPESCADVIRAFFDWRAPRAEAVARVRVHLRELRTGPLTLLRRRAVLVCVEEFAPTRPVFGGYQRLPTSGSARVVPLKWRLRLLLASAVRDSIFDVRHVVTSRFPGVLTRAASVLMRRMTM
jgi:hypothetical protein